MGRRFTKLAADGIGEAAAWLRGFGVTDNAIVGGVALVGLAFGVKPAVRFIKDAKYALALAVIRPKNLPSLPRAQAIERSAAERTIVGGPANRAAFETYKDSLRAGMEKPFTSDPRLSSILDDLYRPNATVGSGSTAAAVRQELATGTSVGGKMHSQKAADSIRTLEKWLERNPTARPGDRAAAENVIKDTRNALGW